MHAWKSMGRPAVKGGSCAETMVSGWGYDSPEMVETMLQADISGPDEQSVNDTVRLAADAITHAKEQYSTSL